MKHTKILFWLPQLGLGGTEKTCLLFGQYLSDEFEPFLCYPGDCGHQQRLEEFRNTFGADHVIPLTTMQSIIDEHDIDIVHSFRSGYSEFPEPGKDFEGPHFVETNVFGQFDFNPLVKRSLFMSEWLLKQTRKRASIMRVHVPQERWSFINNPVVGPQHDTNMREDLDISDDTIILGRCGRPDCGIYDDVNVKAALMLMSRGYDIHFLSMAPPQNMQDDLEKYGIPHTNIEPNIDPWILTMFYNTVDIYTHARADGETYGVNIAEAMIHGKPVVTHIAVPSHPEMGVFQAQTTLVDNGVTGFVVERDPWAYANAVKKLIDDEDLRLTMGKVGKAKIVREGLADVCAEKLGSVYRGLMNE